MMNLIHRTQRARAAGIGALASLLSLGALACDEAPAPATTPPPAMEPTHPDVWSPVEPSDQGPVSLDPALVREGKIARRLSVDQLRRSIPVLFGDVTWTVPVREGARREVPAFDALSRTLGEADYLQVTASNLDASPLFAKFMDDMAGDVCSKAIERDRTAPPASRVILSDGPVDANLRRLRLGFHGILVPEGSTDGIADLRQLHDEVVAETGNAEDGWYAVCVALVTAPELMAY